MGTADWPGAAGAPLLDDLRACTLREFDTASACAKAPQNLESAAEHIAGLQKQLGSAQQIMHAHFHTDTAWGLEERMMCTGRLEGYAQVATIKSVS